MSVVSLSATAACERCRRVVTIPVTTPVDSGAAVVARLAESGWRVADAVLVCPGCVADAVCTAVGHVFAAWRPCRCRGELAGHAAPLTAGCGYEFRWCVRCVVCAERHALDLPAGDDEVCLGGVA